MDLLVLDAPEVRYPPGDERTHRASQIQTETQLRKWLAAGEYQFDCSQTAEILCVVAGLDWPASMVDGYTGTMLRGLPHYSDPANADVGALCVFGAWPGTHVCQVRHPGRNPTLYSHGADRSSHFVSLSQERTFHKGPVTFLSIAAL